MRNHNLFTALLCFVAVFPGCSACTRAEEYEAIASRLNRAAKSASDDEAATSNAVGELIGVLHSLPGTDSAAEAGRMRVASQAFSLYSEFGPSSDDHTTELYMANLLEAFGAFLRRAYSLVSPRLSPAAIEFLDEVLDLAHAEYLRLRLARVPDLDQDPALNLIDNLRKLVDHLENPTLVGSVTSGLTLLSTTRLGLAPVLPRTHA